MSMFHLDESLGFVVNHAAAALRAALERGLAEHDLTAPQWAVLARLLEQDGQPQSQLGRSLHFDKPTISGIVERLEKKRLVRRARDAADARVWRVQMSEHGRALAARLVPLAREVNRVATRGLDGAELEALRALLLRVTANLER